MGALRHVQFPLRGIQMNERTFREPNVAGMLSHRSWPTQPCERRRRRENGETPWLCDLWTLSRWPFPLLFFKEIRNSYFSWREVGKRVVERQVGGGGILPAYATPLGALMACLTQSVEGWIEQKGGASQESEGTAPAWLLWAGTSIFFSAFELERKQSLLASWPFQPLA